MRFKSLVSSIVKSHLQLQLHEFILHSRLKISICVKGENYYRKIIVEYEKEEHSQWPDNVLSLHTKISRIHHRKSWHDRLEPK